MRILIIMVQFGRNINLGVTILVNLEVNTIIDTMDSCKKLSVLSHRVMDRHLIHFIVV